MSGSRTWRSYTSDQGVNYSIQIDKSNASGIPTVPGGSALGALCPPRTVNAPQLPRAVKKRYVNAYNQANPLEKRKFYVASSGQMTALATPGATIAAEDYPGGADAPGVAQTWIVSSIRGEKSRSAPAISAPDTGLTDGTVGQ